MTESTSPRWIDALGPLNYLPNPMSADIALMDVERCIPELVQSLHDCFRKGVSAELTKSEVLRCDETLFDREILDPADPANQAWIGAMIDTVHAQFLVLQAAKIGRRVSDGEAA